MPEQARKLVREIPGARIADPFGPSEKIDALLVRAV
jgi:hypothetical protein